MNNSKPNTTIDAGLINKFWDRVQKSTNCWMWSGSMNVEGYGRIYRKGTTYKAHRLSYMINKGPIPSGLVLDHLCRTKGCVNPDHLEAVTPRENVIRGIGPSAINSAKDVCHNGHQFDNKNTRISSYDGQRVCRTCHNAYMKTRRHLMAVAA